MPPKAKPVNPVEAELKKKGLTLYNFQKDGIEKMMANYGSGRGCINADEMGLGKTCQTVISLLNCFNEGAGPFMVISPLSVCEHWEVEINRFGCGKLKPIKYVGYKDELKEITNNMKFSKASVFIVPYRTFNAPLTRRRLQNAMGDLKFSVVVVDEAQIIKNPEVRMAQLLNQLYSDAIYFLLTGTPIQNNLAELYSLLFYCDKKSFPEHGLEAFLEKYDNAESVGEVAELLKPYMIRRTKKEVFQSLSSCEEVVLYHDMSSLQKTMYKNVISKNADAFKHSGFKANLVCVAMEMRKITIHPYLIQGVEPQPLEEGDHMVETSGKLQVLERLLRYLKTKGHRSLIFSFFKISLDIVQDYLEWKGFSAVRIDGGTRASDRVERINAFQKGKGHKIGRGDTEEPWIFMATTKTGGVGLNLTAADTVIFLDSDWNPQNDIQAMARCHRIGQEKPVRVIRLVCRFTIDQYMLVRAREKLKLSDAVMEADESKVSSAVDFNKAIRSGFADFLEQKTTKTFHCTDAELENVIGATNKNGEWSPLTKEQKDHFLDIDDGAKDVDTHDLRTFQGVCYRISERDDEAFSQLLRLQETAPRRKRVAVDYAVYESMDITKTPLKQVVEEDVSPPKKLPLACRIEKTRENVKAWLERGAIDDSDDDASVLDAAEAEEDEEILIVEEVAAITVVTE